MQPPTDDADEPARAPKTQAPTPAKPAGARDGAGAVAGAARRGTDARAREDSGAPADDDGDGPGGKYTPLDKEVLKFEKKIREVEKLKQRLAEGEVLEHLQRIKVLKEDTIRTRYEQLLLQQASQQAQQVQNDQQAPQPAQARQPAPPMQQSKQGRPSDREEVATAPEKAARAAPSAPWGSKLRGGDPAAVSPAQAPAPTPELVACGFLAAPPLPMGIPAGMAPVGPGTALIATGSASGGVPCGMPVVVGQAPMGVCAGGGGGGHDAKEEPAGAQVRRTPLRAPPKDKDLFRPGFIPGFFGATADAAALVGDASAGTGPAGAANMDASGAAFPGADLQAQPFAMFDASGQVVAVQCQADEPRGDAPWNSCWEWVKKGWCPRGPTCRWEHPPLHAGIWAEDQQQLMAQQQQGDFDFAQQQQYAPHGPQQPYAPHGPQPVGTLPFGAFGGVACAPSEAFGLCGGAMSGPMAAQCGVVLASPMMGAAMPQAMLAQGMMATEQAMGLGMAGGVDFGHAQMTPRGED